MPLNPVPVVQIDRKYAMVRSMECCLTGEKPFPEFIMPQSTDA